MEIMEPEKITAPAIRLGDRIRLTTADHVTHELVVGQIGHRDYVIRPVQSRNTVTLIDLAPSDTVELLDRPPSPAAAVVDALHSLTEEQTAALVADVPALAAALARLADEVRS